MKVLSDFHRSWRVWVLPALVGALLLGGVELHSEHAALLHGAVGEETVASCGPGQPLHLDAYEVRAPDCPACLYKLQTSGAHLVTLALLPGARAPEFLAPAAPQHAFGADLAAASIRGPPAA